MIRSELGWTARFGVVLQVSGLSMTRGPSTSTDVDPARDGEI